MAAMCLALLAGGAPGASAGTVTGKFVHDAGECPGQPARVPLADAPFRVSRNGAKTVTGRLNSKGSLRARIGGRGPAKLTVTLADRRIRVMPPGAGAKPYSFGHVYQRGRGHVVVILSGDQSGGAANIWSLLHGGADVAAKALPPGVRLRRVTAIFKDEYDAAADDDISSSAYDPASEEILVGSRGRADQWEPWVLLHEYGHHVHRLVAPIGPEQQGEHSADGVYPDQPALPFAEGFAHA